VIDIRELWNSFDPAVWQQALQRYNELVRRGDRELDRALDPIDLEGLRRLDPRGWYDFLHDKYFRWKYTAPNRLATTRARLRSYLRENGLDVLFDLKKRLLDLDPFDTAHALATAQQIRGLGTAGASGLLSLMYPHAFATVDQFLVRALQAIPGLPQAAALTRMKPEGLNIKDGVLLMDILRAKANENNRRMHADDWTPRKLDKILWTYGSARQPAASRVAR
jgi:hypothetical protein